MEQYSWPDGFACRCMELTLKEHHGNGWTENDQYNYYRIAEYYYFYLDMSSRQGNRAFDRLRRGLKEWLEGKSDEECRELAIDMLEKARCFSQRIYNDNAVCSLPLEDKQWLRKMARGGGKKPGIAGAYFSEFVFLLQEFGRIWAARLLKEHRIDIHTLEQESYSFLMPYDAGKDGYDYRYYVDHYYTNDSPNTCCVNNDRKAKDLLYSLYGKKIEVKFEGQTDIKPELPSAGDTRDGDNGINGLPSAVPEYSYMWTERAKSCFEEAVKKGWMIMENSKYIWCGINKKPNGKPNKSELAYFLGKVYGFKFENGNNCGAELPPSLNKYFGFNKKLPDTLLQLYRKNKIQSYRPIIDDFFNSLEKHKEEKSEEKVIVK